MQKSGSFQDNVHRKSSPVVGIGYMQKNESDQESIQQPRRPTVGCFTSLITTGLIPYNAVPTHKFEIPEGTNMEDVQTDKYWTRWYALFLSSGLFFNLVFVWGSFGPISETMLEAYPSWNNNTIASLPLYTSIIIFLFGLPMNWVVQMTGLRPGLVMVGIITASSATLRCLSYDEFTFKVLCVVCSFTLGFAMSLTLALPAPIAAVWFPINERTLATAIGGLATQLGYAGMYLAPLLVKVPEDLEAPSDIWKARHEVNFLMKMYASTLWVFTGMAILYFPSRPPLPPTLTASEKPLSFFNGLKFLIWNKNAVLGLLAYIISYGIITEWLGVISFTLTDIGFKQDEIMQIGTSSIAMSAFASALSGAIADNYLSTKRIPIVVLLVLSALSFTFLLLMHCHLLYASIFRVQVAVGCALTFQYAAVPLLVDMTVEMAYPCSGNVVGSLMAVGYNGLALAFLGGFQIPVESYLWVTIVLVISQTLSIIPIIFINETNVKYERDTLHMTAIFHKKKIIVDNKTLAHIIDSQKKIIDSMT